MTGSAAISRPRRWEGSAETRLSVREVVRRVATGQLVFIRPSPTRLAVGALITVLRGGNLRNLGLPPLPDGVRLHVGAGQTILPDYENLDAYPNERRPDHFQTTVQVFRRAEALDRDYAPESVAEIRCHHVFEHISILDVDRTLRGWNRILKPNGLVWIEVPDFERCARKILRLRDEPQKEIFYRAVFGSQMGPGEIHLNGFTPNRLMRLLEDYGFSVGQAYVSWQKREARKPDMYSPANLPLPSLTVKAVKVGPPREELLRAEWTHIAYRRRYPNPELEDR